MARHSIDYVNNTSQISGSTSAPSSWPPLPQPSLPLLTMAGKCMGEGRAEPWWKGEWLRGRPHLVVWATEGRGDEPLSFRGEEGQAPACMWRRRLA